MNPAELDVFRQFQGRNILRMGKNGLQRSEKFAQHAYEVVHTWSSQVRIELSMIWGRHAIRGSCRGNSWRFLCSALSLINFYPPKNPHLCDMSARVYMDFRKCKYTWLGKMVIIKDDIMNATTSELNRSDKVHHCSCSFSTNRLLGKSARFIPHPTLDQHASINKSYFARLARLASIYSEMSSLGNFRSHWPTTSGRSTTSYI